MTKPLPSPIPYRTYHGQDLPDPALYDYVTDSHGVVKRVRTCHFYAVSRVAFGFVRGLAKWPEEGVLLNVPKIPVAWLGRVLEHARRAGSQGTVARPIEQLYFFHYRPVSPDRDGWRVEVPKQAASAARVSYRGGQAGSIVLDLHSHHEMAAYFSRTDDGDEQGARFYAVIGRIYSRPEIRLRLGLYGEFLDLPATCLFEGAGPFIDTYEYERIQHYDNEFQ